MHTASAYRTEAPERPKNARRLSLWYGCLMALFAVFLLRLFYLQVLRHDFYQKVALSGQLKQYDIPAERGVIRAYDGSQVVPLVLNEKRYNLIADPKTVKDPIRTSNVLAPLLNADAGKLKEQVTQNNRYEILAKKLSKEQNDKVTALKLPGIYSEAVTVRNYPQNELASQLLGFVDDEGTGKYGVEQALNKTLSGSKGRLKAITDQSGVPLLATGENVLIDPIDGQDVVLTIDLGMQRQLEDILKSGLDAAKSKSGSVVILDPNTGAVKAMANYPTYNPAEFYKVEDASLFLNDAVSSPYEVGSVMKPLTAAAALDQGVVNKNSSYYDPARFKIDDATVTNIEEDGGPGQRSIADILQLSLNTGATWLLMQMGGGTINQKARTAWNDYMVNRYNFGSKTGIEQGFEADGYVPDPLKGDGLNIRYANTAFGQGLLITPLQMGAALSAVINGGKYYRPYLVDRTVTTDGKETVTKPVVVHDHVVSQDVGNDIKEFMEYVVHKNLPSADREGYSVGGKTGTAQIAKPGGVGGYYEDRFNGSYLGFVGGDKPQYVVVVRVNEPAIRGYAGSQAAAPIFASTANMLINNFNVTPK